MHDRRFNLFRAYTGYLKSSSDESEVIHASWENRGDVGLSLLEATEFDTKDSLILELEISYYPESKTAFGSAPTMVEKSKTKQTLEIEAAAKKEENLIKHGFGSKSVSRVSPELYVYNPTEGCEPKKQKFSFEIMFQNRKKAAEEEKAKLKFVNLGIFHSLNKCMLFQVVIQEKKVMMPRCAISQPVLVKISEKTVKK